MENDSLKTHPHLMFIQKFKWPLYTISIMIEYLKLCLNNDEIFDYII